MVQRTRGFAVVPGESKTEDEFVVVSGVLWNNAIIFFFSAYFFPCLSRDVKISISILARAESSKRSSREMTYRESREDFFSFNNFRSPSLGALRGARARGGGGCV